MSETFARQSFLGPNSEPALSSTNIGIVGLGGGGSHVVQQLAHVGIGRFTLFDPQQMEDSNLNRLVGATARDVAKATWKTAIARRLIRGIRPTAVVKEFRSDWRIAATALRDCDVIVGCVDTFIARSELERQARRYLTPYVDIGMDIHERSGGGYFIGGQVLLSMPGQPCLRCMGFLRDELLAKEADGYGAAGERPQVVWSNGCLASIAVGVVVQLCSPWHHNDIIPIYVEYDGNRLELKRSLLTALAPSACPHFPTSETGDPWLST